MQAFLYRYDGIKAYRIPVVNLGRRPVKGLPQEEFADLSYNKATGLDTAGLFSDTGYKIAVEAA